MYFKISVLFNKHIKDKITRTVLLPVRLRNMKINAMKLLFQIIFFKTFREHFSTYALESWRQVAYGIVQPVFGSSGYFTFWGHNSIEQIPQKGLSQGECVCVWGWREEDAAGERTVFQSLEQHSIDHDYYFQV